MAAAPRLARRRYVSAGRPATGAARCARYLAILTAALAQQFFARIVQEEVEAADDEVLRRLRDVDQRLERIESALRER